MIIGISGKIGSGKDTVGSILQDYSDKDYEIKKYADKLKDIVCLLIGCTREQLEDREYKETELGEEWRQYFNDDYDLVCEKESTFSSLLTPRKILQLLGTEAGREIIHPNIWVNSLYADYNATGFDYKGSENKEIKGDWIYPNWIITDVRFPNEAQAIKDRGGIVIRVERPGGESHCGGAHASETALDTFDFDIVINNEGNIDELIDKVKQLNLV